MVNFVIREQAYSNPHHLHVISFQKKTIFQKVGIDFNKGFRLERGLKWRNFLERKSGWRSSLRAH